MSDMTNHSYPGEYQSAIARAKRILLAAGFAWSKTTGRYTAFASTQRTSRGVRVTRVGVSETIALHTYAEDAARGSESEAARVERRSTQQRAIDALRAAGMPFDDRGWLACGRDAVKAPATKVGAEGYSRGMAIGVPGSAHPPESVKPAPLVSAHTPGPWKAKGHTVSCSKGVVVEVHDYPDATDEERANVLADARLIAAAPDSNEVCALVVAAADAPAANSKVGTTRPTEKQWVEIVANARAAIAKARGK